MVLQIRNLHLAFGSKKVLKGIDLELNKGEVLALVGESGAGKTTLGLAIGGLAGQKNTLPGKTGKEAGEVQTEGQILFADRDILTLTEEELRRLRWKEISFVFQNVANALNPLLTIQEQVAEPFWAHGLGSRQEAWARAAQMLEEVRFPAAKSSYYPHQLSGGEIQRALIAMALINKPQVIILDEPTASLDPLTRQEITALLAQIAGESAMLLITHDLAGAAALSTRTAVLYQGKVLEEGPTEKVLQTPHHPYMRALLRSYPRLETSKDLQAAKLTLETPTQGCIYYPRCTQALAVCRTENPPLLEYKLAVLPADDSSRAAPNSPSGIPSFIPSKVACHRGGIVPYLVTHRLAKKYSGFHLRPLSFIVFEGETVALVGESGSGKSTLAKLIMGLEKADQGTILLEEEKVPYPRKKEFFRQVQLIFQNPYEAINPRLTIREIVEEPLVIQKLDRSQNSKDRVCQVLKEVGLPSKDSFLESYPIALSGGELQRLVIARSLILEPKLLIADEPTSALDALVQARVVKLLLELQEKRGLGMLFISHDIALARKIADRILVMQNGVLVEQGLSWEITSRPRHPYTKQLIEAAAVI